MYRSGHVVHDYALCRWESESIKIACLQSKEERDEVKNKFESQLQNARKQLKVLDERCRNNFCKGKRTMKETNMAMMKAGQAAEEEA